MSLRRRWHIYAHTRPPFCRCRLRESSYIFLGNPCRARDRCTHTRSTVIRTSSRAPGVLAPNSERARRLARLLSRRRCSGIGPRLRKRQKVTFEETLSVSIGIQVGHLHAYRFVFMRQLLQLLSKHRTTNIGSISSYCAIFGFVFLRE